MWGDSAQWSPWTHVQKRHPDVQVIEMELPGQLQGCVDHDQRIIWLAAGLDTRQRRCTLAYEIGQLEQGPTPTDPCLAAAHRRAAEDWAARMLIPTRGLLEGFSKSYSLAQIADGLQVDLPMLRARLRGLSDAEQDAVMDTIRDMTAVG